MRGVTSATEPLLARWRTAAAELKSFVTAEPFSAAQMAAAASRLRSTVLTYWVNRDALYIWVVKPDATVHSTLVKVTRDRLSNLIAANWSGPAPGANRGGEPEILMRSGQPLALSLAGKDSWKELYRLLIHPVRQHLPSAPDSLLTIVPHGPLFQLPFAALIDENGAYLIERYRLHYTPAGAVLDFTRSKKSSQDLPPSLLLVADPAGMTAPDGKSLPALPGARREVRSIASLLPGISVTSLVGKQATESSVRAAAAGKSAVHFATHGILNPNDPPSSFLALAGVTPDPVNDGRLTVSEVYGLDLNADLVVLSACRSALGALSSDGIIGLTRAFFYAGTPTVMATLWDVADEPTSRLISSFYREYARSGAKSHALRLAQLNLIAALRAGRVRVPSLAGTLTLPEHPLFWAAFVLAGEP
jgi:CHAT domain-containing protein